MIMKTQQEKKHFSSSDSKEDSNKLECRYQFCGHTLRITGDSSNKVVIPATIWEALSPMFGGLVLCRFFEKENISFSGKKLIELGSDTGIVGILAILLGGDVTLTDKPEVLNQMELNVATYVPSSIIQRSNVSALSWGENHDQFPTDNDIILGSNMVYKKREFHLLLETLQHMSNQKHDHLHLLQDARVHGSHHIFTSSSFHSILTPKLFIVSQIKKSTCTK
ncbi:EEF1A lysine methyltransferase 3-like [Heptranchias perlo]|uniref:EEF1A lysine methyltransferase 3-like n=1 Tax=Heptranchias perlo TaxID=212740 RepID=UPI00355A9ED5